MTENYKIFGMQNMDLFTPSMFQIPMPYNFGNVKMETDEGNLSDIGKYIREWNRLSTSEKLNMLKNNSLKIYLKTPKNFHCKKIIAHYKSYSRVCGNKLELEKEWTNLDLTNAYKNKAGNREFTLKGDVCALGLSFDVTLGTDFPYNDIYYLYDNLENPYYPNNFYIDLGGLVRNATVKMYAKNERWTWWNGIYVLFKDLDCDSHEAKNKGNWKIYPDNGKNSNLQEENKAEEMFSLNEEIALEGLKLKEDSEIKQFLKNLDPALFYYYKGFYNTMLNFINAYFLTNTDLVKANSKTVDPVVNTAFGILGKIPTIGTAIQIIYDTAKTLYENKKKDDFKAIEKVICNIFQYHEDITLRCDLEKIISNLAYYLTLRKSKHGLDYDEEEIAIEKAQKELFSIIWESLKEALLLIPGINLLILTIEYFLKNEEKENLDNKTEEEKKEELKLKGVKKGINDASLIIFYIYGHPLFFKKQGLVNSLYDIMILEKNFAKTKKKILDKKNKNKNVNMLGNYPFGFLFPIIDLEYSKNDNSLGQQLYDLLIPEF